MEDKLYTIGIYEQRDEIDVEFKAYDILPNPYDREGWEKEIYINAYLFTSSQNSTNYIGEQYLNHWFKIIEQLTVFYTTDYALACEAYNNRIEWVLNNLRAERKNISRKISRLNKFQNIGVEI
jgi:hypothetical protein